ncbi:hypothetical protein B0J11DRAFT_9097 [Dendryphion nanum]|uniref:Uncharacterized protein n=1 Tax=Dendryphion nanum TaxID=256645 RepID=A0A9P9J109_9PLEO|nr:hypothetical protein B0J11DRAFT_9097 [Dendryphion nanum]
MPRWTPRSFIGLLTASSPHHPPALTVLFLLHAPKASCGRPLSLVGKRGEIFSCVELKLDCLEMAITERGPGQGSSDSATTHEPQVPREKRVPWNACSLPCGRNGFWNEGRET